MSSSRTSTPGQGSLRGGATGDYPGDAGHPSGLTPTPTPSFGAAQGGGTADDGGKGKKRRGKKVKLSREERLEVQRYENTISDLTRRLEEETERAGRLEAERDDAALRAKEATDDRDKIASFLTDRIREKEVAAREAADAHAKLQEQLDQAAIDAEQALEDKEEAAVERENELKAEIAGLKDELHQLVAFKTIKNHVEKEIADTKELLKTEREKHREKLGEVERKALKEKEDLKKERAKQMREISERISKMTNDQLEVITKRTILENSTMKTQLSYQSKRTEGIIAENEKLMQRNTQLRQEKELYETLQQQIAKKNKILQRASERDKEKVKQMETELESFRAEFGITGAGSDASTGNVTSSGNGNRYGAARRGGGRGSGRRNGGSSTVISELENTLMMREEELHSAQAAYHEAIAELENLRERHLALRSEYSKVIDTRNETAALLLAAMEDVRREIENEAGGPSAGAAAAGTVGPDMQAVTHSLRVNFDELGPREREVVLRKLFSKLNAFSTASSAAGGSAGGGLPPRGDGTTSASASQGHIQGVPPLSSAGGGRNSRGGSAGISGGDSGSHPHAGTTPTPPGSSHSVRFPRIPTAGQRSQLSSQGSEMDFSSANVSNYVNFFGNPFPASPRTGASRGGLRGSGSRSHLRETRSVAVQTEARGRVYKSDRIGDGARIMAANAPIAFVSGSGDGAPPIGRGESPIEQYGDRPWGRKSQMVPLSNRGPSTFLKRGGGR